MKPRTFYDKIWADHLVDEQPDGTCLLYIDRHIVHEVTSPQAFEGLRLSGRKVHSPEKTLLVVDHNVPTTDRKLPNPDPESAAQIAYLAENAKHFGLEYYDEFDIRQGICHVIGPEQGFTLPGTTLVCGDSHTATHGAFGALAYGIGTSEVEHVLATQTLVQTKSKNMRALVEGKLPPNVTAKDIILAIIGEIGTAGGTGHVIEYAGEAIRADDRDDDIDRRRPGVQLPAADLGDDRGHQGRGDEHRDRGQQEASRESLAVAAEEDRTEDPGAAEQQQQQGGRLAAHLRLFAGRCGNPVVGRYYFAAGNCYICASWSEKTFPTVGASDGAG